MDLQLQLNGSLLGGLDFNVAVPTADSRIQALVEGALVSEEEVQRLACLASLRSTNSSLPTPPKRQSADSFNLQSTQFLPIGPLDYTNRTRNGRWVGLWNALSGEQAVGLALSTQLLNDRLHIEGK